MLVSMDWLSEYVDIEGLSAETVANSLTMSGLEVEEIEKKGSNFENIKTVEIVELNPHPNADKLRLVDIFDSETKKTVVCGAQNIEKGQIIPYASVGSKVLDRKTGEKFELQPASIRGVTSEGMLCSADELGLNKEDFGQEEDGILILNRFLPDVKVGEDIKKVLNIQEDTILHVAPTANRGDQMSLLGVAREVCALFNRKLKFSNIEYFNNGNVDFEVEIKDESACKYYSLGILKDVKIGESPEWMKRRLENSGIRSISNVVDITNYVMLEYGQPLHAFDADKLDEKYLCVRYAEENEKIKTLDETERNLTKESVLIANSKEGVALAGVMGGFSSEIDNNTSNIAVEAAYFCPASTRKNARIAGLRTEASARIERGVNINSTKPALIRAMQLLTEFAGAKAEGIVETGNNHPPLIEITLRFNQVKRILGIEIENKKCIEILENLGFAFLGGNEIAAKFSVPGYRSEDVTREIDLIEEISRIYGYDKIIPSLPSKTMPVIVSNRTKTIKKIHEILLGKGFYEIVTSSLTGEPILNKLGLSYDGDSVVKIANPQTVDHTMLRQGMLSNLLTIVKNNFDVGEKNLAFYEIGKTYRKTAKATEKSSGVTEKTTLSACLTGFIEPNLLKQSDKADFFLLKGVIENIFSELKIENRIEYQPAQIDFMHPARTAEIKLKAKGMPTIGFIGEVHPNILEKAKINEKVYVLELDLENILDEMKFSVPKYIELPLYPSVSRDMAFITDEKVSNQNIIKTIEKSSSQILEKIEIFDVYKGANIGQDKKSVAYRLTFLDKAATLTDDKVDTEMIKIKAALQKAFSGISFRE